MHFNAFLSFSKFSIYNASPGVFWDVQRIQRMCLTLALHYSKFHYIFHLESLAIISIGPPSMGAGNGFFVPFFTRVMALPIHYASLDID